MDINAIIEHLNELPEFIIHSEVAYNGNMLYHVAIKYPMGQHEITARFLDKNAAIRSAYGFMSGSMWEMCNVIEIELYGEFR